MLVERLLTRKKWVPLRTTLGPTTFAAPGNCHVSGRFRFQRLQGADGVAQHPLVQFEAIKVNDLTFGFIMGNSPAGG